MQFKLWLEMVDEDPFQKMLDDNPADYGTRLVFADWLEEQGDWRAAGYRWMGENEKYPTVLPMYVLFNLNTTPSDMLGGSPELNNEFIRSIRNKFCWKSPSKYGIKSNELDDIRFKNLSGNIHERLPHYKFYNSRRLAEEALCKLF